MDPALAEVFAETLDAARGIGVVLDVNKQVEGCKYIEVRCHIQRALGAPVETCWTCCEADESKADEQLREKMDFMTERLLSMGFTQQSINNAYAKAETLNNGKPCISPLQTKTQIQ
jgi:hypothetical protein